MKVLFIASVYRHLTAFHIPYIQYFQNRGCKVYAAGTGEEDKKNLEKINVTCIDIPFSRSPLNLQNIAAYKQLQQLFVKERFELVHVHTPVAALLTRAAFRKSNYGKMVYTAHGFHFFSGAPKQNWLIYYPAEKLAAKWTDHLITINEEDFKNAQSLLPRDKISFVHGVGVEFAENDFSQQEKHQLRVQLGLADDAITIAYVAELNDNKNHQFLLNNWRKIKESTPQFELLIIGTGDKERQLKEYVIDEQLAGVHFLGYRRDVPKLLKITDIVALLSHREGLPKSIMEAMAAEIPCVVTNTRGLRDLVKSNENGFVVNHGADAELIAAFYALREKRQRDKMGQCAKLLVDPFLLNNVIEEYAAIYDQLIEQVKE
ncbi:glycosyltransferase family 4 protein [Bacillus ndiopicus]|uniref:glycosyltransferase family 4 protein n=1 Tax=Bacillus ndiopicus TaxID=1347368 RepID=UPI0005A94201|nr:glycosyltransferase family 4 protein [Bacillus ndiopicus]